MKTPPHRAVAPVGGLRVQFGRSSELGATRRHNERESA